MKVFDCVIISLMVCNLVFACMNLVNSNKTWRDYIESRSFKEDKEN